MQNLVFVVLAMTENGGQLNFHVEKSWLIGLVSALAIQIFAGGWWASGQSSKLNEIDARLHELRGELSSSGTGQGISSEKIARLEVRLDNLTESNKDLSAHLTVIESFLKTYLQGGKH